MRIYAQFDDDGNIHSMITVEAPEGVRAMMDIESDLSVAEIDSVKIKAPSTDSDTEKVRALTKDYRIPVPAATKVKLMKAKK